MILQSPKGNIIWQMQDSRCAMFFSLHIGVFGTISKNGGLYAKGFFFLLFKDEGLYSDNDSRPKNARELFNLRHAQARNIVERIFGIAKRRFGIFSRAPEYPIETQSRLIAAVGALHNFLRIHDQDDDARDLGNDGPSLQREGSQSSFDNFVEGIEPREISPEELGMNITEEERARASARRDAIAQQMWVDYLAYRARHGRDEEEDFN
jgi:hypothetical protein